MTWIFGSFLVTPCALTSCHIGISKRGIAVKSNRCVTGRRPRDNHAVSFRQRQRIESRARDKQPSTDVRSSLTIRLAKKDMGQEEVRSLSICLSIYLSN